MSAFICSPRHIATCAEVIKKEVIDHGSDPKTRDEVAVILASENITSVAWRYSPEGAGFYAKMMAPIIESITASEGLTHEAPGLEIADSPADLPGLMEGETIPSFIEKCRKAAPVPHTPPEGFMYLECLNYQSCEHAGWPSSQAYDWITQAKAGLAYDVIRKDLAGRHVWTVDDDAPTAISDL